MSKTSKNTSESLLRGSSIKVTQARVSLLTALSNERYPLSIREISKKVSAPNQSTLYRTLKTLVDKGLVREVLVDKAEARYEIAVGRKHHHHIVCTSCGAIDDVNVCPPALARDAFKKFAYITGHSLEFFGVCKTCA